MQASPKAGGTKIVVVPSLDYEVFHGRNFLSDDETLFAPTARLMGRASEFGIPLTLFADVLSVPAHRGANDGAFVENFERQLREAIQSGHDVQLHIHAHWARASRASGEWSLANPDITLADFEPSEMEEIIDAAAAYLRNLLVPVDPAYRCIAFRAGGLALQPREKTLIRMLHEAGIEIDSSIARGLRLQLDTLQIDYGCVPDVSNWMISSERGLLGSGACALYEIPIASFSMPLRSRLEFIVRRVRAFRKRRGSGISRARRQTRLANAITLVMENARYLAADPVFLFSADTKGFTRSMLVEGFRRYVARYEGRASKLFVSMINHPKLMFRNEEVLFFDTLRELSQMYGDRLSFATYQQAARQIAKEGVSLSA